MLETTDKLVFDTGKEKLSVEMVCGISAVNLHAQSSFPELFKQAESALGMALQGGNEKMVVFADALAEPEPAITEEDIQQAFRHILQGNHSQIPEAHLSAVVERLQPFMQYIASR
jgi:hypothetical protein